MLGLVVGRHTLSLDNNFNDFNPFQLKRSAGVGLHIFGPVSILSGINSDEKLNVMAKSGFNMGQVIGKRTSSSGSSFNLWKTPLYYFFQIVHFE